MDLSSAVLAVLTIVVLIAAFIAPITGAEDPPGDAPDGRPTEGPGSARRGP
jgi:hypothetical protein